MQKPALDPSSLFACACTHSEGWMHACSLHFYLQKTAPPVLVFAENKRDVDAIHEYLLVQVCPCASVSDCCKRLPMMQAWRINSIQIQSAENSLLVDRFYYQIRKGIR